MIEVSHFKTKWLLLAYVIYLLSRTPFTSPDHMTRTVLGGQVAHFTHHRDESFLAIALNA